MCVVEGSWWLSGKESAYNEGDQGLIPGSGRSPGEENGHPLQYFFFFCSWVPFPDNPLNHPDSNILAWRIPWTEGPGGFNLMAVHGIEKFQTRLWVTNTFTFLIVHLQCCVSFRCTHNNSVMHIYIPLYTYIHTHWFFSSFFSLVGYCWYRYWVESPVLYTRSFLFTNFLL